MTATNMDADKLDLLLQEVVNIREDIGDMQRKISILSAEKSSEGSSVGILEWKKDFSSTNYQLALLHGIDVEEMIIDIPREKRTSKSKKFTIKDIQNYLKNNNRSGDCCGYKSNGKVCDKLGQKKVDNNFYCKTHLEQGKKIEKEQHLLNKKEEKDAIFFSVDNPPTEDSDDEESPFANISPPKKVVNTDKKINKLKSKKKRLNIESILNDNENEISEEEEAIDEAEEIESISGSDEDDEEEAVGSDIELDLEEDNDPELSE